MFKTNHYISTAEAIGTDIAIEEKVPGMEAMWMWGTVGGGVF